MQSSTSFASSSEKIISASLGALVTSIVVTPFDVVKTRMQTVMATPTSAPTHYSACCHNYAYCGGGTAVCSTDVKIKTAYRGTWDGFVSIARQEGLLSLWRGLSPTLVMSLPATVVYFIGYETLRFHLSHTSQFTVDPAPLIAGALARTFAATLISPVELVRTRVQAGSSTYTQIRQDLSTMVHQRGIRSLWRGLAPTLWRDVPFSGIYWMSYELIKRRMAQLIDGQTYEQQVDQSNVSVVYSRSSQDPSWKFAISFIAGAFSGMLAAAVTTPFDVIKTRRQVAPDVSLQTLRSSTFFNNPIHTTEASMSIYALARKIASEEGLRGLLRGLGPRVSKVAPACAMMISSYELGKTYFEHHRDKS